MKVKILTKEETAAKASEILAMPFFRPSHRVVNIFDKKNDTVYLTEFQDFMANRKEEFTTTTSRRLAIQTNADDLIKFLPEELQGEKVEAFTAGDIYFLIAADRYFVVGPRIYGNYMQETRIDGLKLLGEVSAGGEFRPIWIPRFGFVIRAVSRHDYREGIHDHIRYDPEDFEARRMEHSGMFLLIGETGRPIFESGDEDVDLIRLFLGVSEDVDKDYAWRIRNWRYPTLWDIDGENTNYRARRYMRQADGNRICGYAGFGEVKFDLGSGEVVAKTRTGEVKKLDQCVPWTEYAFAETFYS